MHMPCYALAKTPTHNNSENYAPKSTHKKLSTKIKGCEIFIIQKANHGPFSQASYNYLFLRACVGGKGGFIILLATENQFKGVLKVTL